MKQTDPRPLTRAQRTVVDLPADTHSLVLGGAGTGKTHLLIERIVKLLSVDHLAPGQDVLVLTFGRETAAELCRRTVEAGGDAAYVRASTFDSFATGLLAFIEPEGSWRQKSYDARIAAAEKLIQSDERTQRYISRHRHIVVDEIQDLVGVRAALVLTLLRLAGCGFTLLGDPAQAIYNFQLGDCERERGSEPLFDAVRDAYTDLRTCTLSENFRAQTEESRAPLMLGSLLAKRNADYENIRRELETTLLSLKPAPMGLLDRRDGTVAVLCYNNVQALWFSKELFDKGIDHEYRRPRNDRVMAPWIGELLGPLVTSTLSKPDLTELLTNTEGLPSIDSAWSMLSGMDSEARRTIRIDRIAQNIRSGTVGTDLPPSRSRIVVSSVHRAKGLEFDWVVVVKPEFRELDHRSPAEDARLLFVALSRSRKGLFSLETPDTRGWRLSKHGSDRRWVLKPPWTSSAKRIEVRGSDIRDDVPPGASATSSRGSAQETQRYIHKAVRAGDSVSLLLASNPQPMESDLRYRVLHGETAVGETSDAFAAALRRTGLPRRFGKTILPLRIEGLRVESVDTVAGTRAAAERAGLGGPGIWNRVRVFGLGELVYPSAGSRDWTAQSSIGVKGSE